MISGNVTSDLVASIRLTLIGTGGKEVAIEFGIDTGFNEAISLPMALIETLGWKLDIFDFATLADGSECRMGIYRGIVMWHEQPRIVNVVASETKPLLGTMLLERNDLFIRMQNGGAVTITEIA